MTEEEGNEIKEERAGTSEVAKLLGPSSDSDWLLEPETHAERLAPAAASLRRILEHSVVQEIVERFKRADTAAGEAQASYKQLGRWDVYLATAATLLGTVVLTLTTADKESPLFPLCATLRPLLLAVQIGCGAGVAALKYYMQRTAPFVAWQTQRAVAETARVELFETVAGMADRQWEDSAPPDAAPLLPLQLEYFVRYQLDVQLRYYEGRGKQHARAAKQYVTRGALITFGAAIAAAVTAAANEVGDPVSVASVGALLAPILIAAQTSLSRLNQDERNAARYEITSGNLRRRAAGLSDARESAAAGDTAAVHSFIRLVNEVISVEHSEWIVQQQEQVQARGVSSVRAPQQ